MNDYFKFGGRRRTSVNRHVAGTYSCGIKRRLFRASAAAAAWMSSATNGGETRDGNFRALRGILAKSPPAWHVDGSLEL